MLTVQMLDSIGQFVIKENSKDIRLPNFNKLTLVLRLPVLIYTKATYSFAYT